MTYCHTNRKYEQYYVKEFLVYQIYDLITEYSFRAKPMMIDYSDSERREDLITCFGFLIEDVAVDSAPTMTACPRLQGYSGRKTQISWR